MPAGPVVVMSGVGLLTVGVGLSGSSTVGVGLRGGNFLTSLSESDDFVLEVSFTIGEGAG